MNEIFRLRSGAEADVAAIAAIYAHHVETGTASFEIEAPDEREMGKRWATLIGWGYPYLVAEEAGEVLGYAHAGPYRTRPAYRPTVENSIYVRKNAMRRRIGTVLLERLIQECTIRDFRQMVAIIGDSANLASIRLHEHAGFRPVGVLQSVGFKHGSWLDTVLMQLALGAGDSSAP